MDLTAETVELLPSRDTLGWGSVHFGDNLALVLASNSSTAVNFLSIGAFANSGAMQNIGVSQH
ncbi:hypothetical protein SCMU_11660 [Sinomonas cyclohexanicum]|uniref:Uncharacterized protein n=2 Tax=Sinomonas cyclohexanicum TaxID=322009 RepID=A0ABM7PT99_SINCY|nr:hypothetical protein SCMU_11660 [Corynebacterium cyclohexanicum]